MRRRTAVLMERSAREIPHFTVSSDLDVTTALMRLQRLNEQRPVTGRIIP
jgi:pyruvate dehydrogenase E2 component (dihydrolipoamide acetyltransferase)